MLTGDDHMNTNDVSGARAQGGAGSPDAWSSHNGHCGLRPDPDKLIPALLIIAPITSTLGPITDITPLSGSEVLNVRVTGC